MNRKTKIIISITGLTIVLLSLIGLTYGYYAASIQGNSNNKSIQISTDTLKLVYEDEDSSILTGSKIEPGTVVGSKKFTVKNEGKDNKYLVILDNVSITDSTTGSTTTLESNDFVYTLTCSSSDSKTCNQMPGDNKLPLENGGLLVANDIASGTTHTYTITITYLNTNKEQAGNMNRTISARLNIKGVTNPYESNRNLLAYQIINNAMKSTNGTSLKATPDTKPLEQVSNDTERELSITPDDYGTSFYYRGNVDNNYVQFTNMCWRVVRIQGDGSVKLILASELTCESASPESTYYNHYSGLATNGESGKNGSKITTHYGYKIVNGYHVNDYINSEQDNEHSARTQLMSWLERKGIDQTKLKEEKWCIGDLTNAYEYDRSSTWKGLVNSNIINKISFYYTAGFRFSYLKTPRLKCETTGVGGEIDTNKIGMLTMDEVAFAGAGKNTNNSNYYLNQNASVVYWWTLSPSYFSGSSDYALRVNNTGAMDVSSGFVHHNSGYGVRPVVSLVPDTKIQSGTGTLTDPYIIAD